MSIQTLLSPNPPSWLNIYANSISVNDMTIVEDTELQGNLTVDGNATFDNNITVDNIIFGKELSLTQDVVCRNVEPSNNVICGNDISVNGQIVTNGLICETLAEFNSDVQAKFGVTIGTSLNSTRVLDYYRTAQDGPAAVNSSLFPASIRYNRCGKLVTVDVYEAGNTQDGFTANVLGFMHIIPVELTNIAPLLVADLAGRTLYFGAALFTAAPGGEYQPAIVRLDPTGQINMLEPNTTDGKVSANNKFFNFSFSFYSLA